MANPKFKIDTGEDGRSKLIVVPPRFSGLWEKCKLLSGGMFWRAYRAYRAQGGKF